MTPKQFSAQNPNLSSNPFKTAQPLPPTTTKDKTTKQQRRLLASPLTNCGNSSCNNSLSQSLASPSFVQSYGVTSCNCLAPFLIFEEESKTQNEHISCHCFCCRWDSLTYARSPSIPPGKREWAFRSLSANPVTCTSIPCDVLLSISLRFVIVSVTDLLTRISKIRAEQKAAAIRLFCYLSADIEYWIGTSLA